MDTTASRTSDALTNLWTLVSHNATLALAVVGLFLYGIVWTAYSIFYREFGLTPRDVGIEYSQMVQEAAVAVVVYVVIVATVVGGHYLALKACGWSGETTRRAPVARQCASLSGGLERPLAERQESTEGWHGVPSRRMVEPELAS